MSRVISGDGTIAYDRLGSGPGRSSWMARRRLGERAKLLDHADVDLPAEGD
jgi:hypothetical protein